MWSFATLLVISGMIRAGEHAPAYHYPPDLQNDVKLKSIANVFSKAYGGSFKGVFLRDTGGIVMNFKGIDFPYDDGKEKAFEELLDRPDIEDAFRQVYPLGKPSDRWVENFDPGRIRVEALFKVLYGASKEEVARNLVVVDFCGNKVRFSNNCGAAEALRAVSRDLSAVFAVRPALKEYVAELGGTFQWRVIAGTTRLSNHSFGNAIDLNVKKSSYWRWDSSSKIANFSRNQWPMEIVEVFERHGFIWGGKWWHYDTMHFEFRPELIEFARGMSSKGVPGTPDKGEDQKPEVVPKTDFVLPLNESR